MTFKLACYFPTEIPYFFVVNIKSDAWVQELLQAIQVDIQSSHQEVKLADLRLFKVKLIFLFLYRKQSTNPQKTDVLLDPSEDLQSRALQWLHRQPADSHLNPMTKLKRIFPTGPCQSGDCLDIIIADMEGMLYLSFNLILLISCQFWS